MMHRPSDHYHNAITDPADFVGRQSLLETIRNSPTVFRVLLGGRRIGKTSLLQAVEWRLLQPDLRRPLRAFPVYLNLGTERPQSLPHLRHLLVVRLHREIARWGRGDLPKIIETSKGAWARVEEIKLGVDVLVKLEMKLNLKKSGEGSILDHSKFVESLVATIQELQNWRLEGLCYLIDESEYIIKQTWSDDAWSYLRSLKDSEDSLKPWLGVILSGHRDLKRFRMKTASPLNIAKIDRLSSLTDPEVKDLVLLRSSRERCLVSEEEIRLVVEWAGGHPFLTQQILNGLFDSRHERRSVTVEQVASRLLRQLGSCFANWWNMDGSSDGFGEDERSLYRALVEQREGDILDLATLASISQGRAMDAADVLVGTGVAAWLDEDRIRVGARMFERWVELYDPK